MFAAMPHEPGSTTRATPFADPIAMDLLEGQAQPARALAALGAFPSQRGLGFAFSIPMLTRAIPTIVGLIRQVQGQGQSVTDPVSAVWRRLPASAVNARVGPENWWYDLTDGRRLTNEEAALRQQEVVAASIGAHVGDEGWWIDNATNQTLNHAEAWRRYQALSGSNGTMAHNPFPAGNGANTSGSGGTGLGPSSAGIAGMFGNIPPLVLVGGAVAVFFLLRKRGR